MHSLLYDSNFELMDMVEFEEHQVRERNEQLLRTVVIEEQRKALQEKKMDLGVI